MLANDSLERKLGETLLSFDPDKFIGEVNSALKEGSSPNQVIESLAEALKEIGRRFENGELFLVHLVTAARAHPSHLTGPKR